MEKLDLTDVVGKRIIATSTYAQRDHIREENAIAALEVMSRWAIDPRWLVYLPPTMAPTATTKVDGLLEHPNEAFEDVPRGRCRDRWSAKKKHMGSRAIVVVCRNSAAAAQSFTSRRPFTRRHFTREPVARSSRIPADETVMLDRVRGFHQRSRTLGRTRDRLADARL